MRYPIVFCLVSALFTAALLAQEHPNLAKGFNPEKAYQVGDIDVIDLFSGNVVHTLPIGQTYPVASGFSYSFKLVHNNRPWIHYTDRECGDDSCIHYWEVVVSIPDNVASNAGLGWLGSWPEVFGGRLPERRLIVHEKPLVTYQPFRLLLVANRGDMIDEPARDFLAKRLIPPGEDHESVPELVDGPGHAISDLGVESAEREKALQLAFVLTRHLHRELELLRVALHDVLHGKSHRSLDQGLTACHAGFPPSFAWLTPAGAIPCSFGRREDRPRPSAGPDSTCHGPLRRQQLQIRRQRQGRNHLPAGLPALLHLLGGQRDPDGGPGRLLRHFTCFLLRL